MNFGEHNTPYLLGLLCKKMKKVSFIKAMINGSLTRLATFFLPSKTRDLSERPNGHMKNSTVYRTSCQYTLRLYIKLRSHRVKPPTTTPVRLHLPNSLIQLSFNFYPVLTHFSSNYFPIIIQLLPNSFPTHLIIIEFLPYSHPILIYFLPSILIPLSSSSHRIPIQFSSNSHASLILFSPISHQILTQLLIIQFIPFSFNSSLILIQLSSDSHPILPKPIEFSYTIIAQFSYRISRKSFFHTTSKK